MTSGQLVTSKLVTPDGFSIPLGEITESLITKVLKARDRMPEQCLHRRDKTLPPRALRKNTVLNYREICSFCQQSANCSVRVSQTSFDFN